jgi:hypothetical protein
VVKAQSRMLLGALIQGYGSEPYPQIFDQAVNTLQGQMFLLISRKRKFKAKTFCSLGLWNENGG